MGIARISTYQSLSKEGAYLAHDIHNKNKKYERNVKFFKIFLFISIIINLFLTYKILK